MSDRWSDHGETPEQRESRLAMCACLNSDVIYRGVRDGLCYFEVYFTDESDDPKAVLFLPTEGLTAEKVGQRELSRPEKPDLITHLCLQSYVGHRDKFWHRARVNAL